jgi:hypothetical protein
MLSLGAGQRLPSTLELQERLGVGSGTVQKAFHLLEETGVATTDSRGHLGRFVVSLDPGRIWSLAGLPAIHAVLTPPGAFEIYALVDGLLDEFARLGLSLQINYQRGNMKRLERVGSSETSFAVMSSGAAASLRRDDLVIASLGKDTYYSPGSIVALSRIGGPAAAELGRPLRVGVDRESSDHLELSRAEYNETTEIEFVDCQFPKVPAEILAERIDVGIWHRMMLIVPLELMGLAAHPLSPSAAALLTSRSAASIVFSQTNLELTKVLDYVDLERVATAQKRRLEELRTEDLNDTGWGY